MKKIIYFILAFFVFSLSFVSSHVGEDEFAHHNMMGNGYYSLGMAFFGWIFIILVFVALVLLIIWLLKQIQKK